VLVSNRGAANARCVNSYRHTMSSQYRNRATPALLWRLVHRVRNYRLPTIDCAMRRNKVSGPKLYGVFEGQLPRMIAASSALSVEGV
jgi:hypothetical protein